MHDVVGPTDANERLSDALRRLLDEADGRPLMIREMIEILQKTRQPFNVNAVAQIGALAGLADEAHQQETKRMVDEGRVYLQEQIGKLKLEFVPSAANFVMVNVGDGPGIFKELLARRIIVRPLKGYNLPEWVRISIGTMKQNRKCIAALKEVLSNDRQE